MKKRCAVIVAGGMGTRLNAGIPKQFLLLNGKPVLLYSVESFFGFDADIHIVIVLPEEHVNLWHSICRDFKVKIPHEIVYGGKERFFSVKNGLQKAGNANYIAVHDGARPLLSKNLIRLCFEAAETFKAIVPAVTPAESVRCGNAFNSKMLNRNEVFLIQTPQVFDASIIKQAYNIEFSSSFTDDASVVEHSGHKVTIIDGEYVNVKITHPHDIKYCEFLLHSNCLE